MEKSFLDALWFLLKFLLFYFNGRMRDPSAVLRLIVLGFGFVLVFVICLMAAVGDV